MIRLVYVSKCTTQMSEEDLLAMLKNARPRNHDIGVTGMLLHASGNFIQVLEGEKHAVDELFAKISKDERHKDCTIIDHSEIKTRSFPEWSMGFKLLNDSTKTDGFSEFMQRPMSPKELSKNPTSIMSLLYSFKSESQLTS